MIADLVPSTPTFTVEAEIDDHLREVKQAIADTIMFGSTAAEHDAALLILEAAEYLPGTGGATQQIAVTIDAAMPQPYSVLYLRTPPGAANTGSVELAITDSTPTTTTLRLKRIGGADLAASELQPGALYGFYFAAGTADIRATLLYNNAIRRATELTQVVNGVVADVVINGLDFDMDFSKGTIFEVDCSYGTSTNYIITGRVSVPATAPCEFQVRLKKMKSTTSDKIVQVAGGRRAANSIDKNATFSVARGFYDGSLYWLST